MDAAGSLGDELFCPLNDRHALLHAFFARLFVVCSLFFRSIFRTLLELVEALLQAFDIADHTGFVKVVPCFFDRADDVVGFRAGCQALFQ